MPFWSRKKKSKATALASAPPNQSRQRLVPLPVRAPERRSTTAQQAEVFRLQGDRLAENGDFDSAIVMNNSAMQLAPNDFDLYLSRSLAHMMSSPRYLDLALKDADDAICLKPEDSRGWSQKGKVFIQMGDYKSAVEMLTHALGCVKPHERVAVQRALDAARSQSAVQTRISPYSSPSSLPDQTVTTSSPTPQPASVPIPLPSTEIPGSSGSPPVSAYDAPAGIASTQSAAPLVSSPQPSNRLWTPSKMQGTSQTQKSTSPSSRLPTGQSNSSYSVPQTPTTPATSASLSSSPSTQAPFNATNNAFSTIPQERRASTSTTSLNQPNQDQSSKTQTVNRTSAPPFNLIPQELFGDLSPDSPPLPYTENFRDPVVLDQKIKALRQNLEVRNKGCLGILPYKVAGGVNVIRLAYFGMAEDELTPSMLGTPTYLHPSFSKMFCSAEDYPGNTLLDLDCEVSGLYDGKIPGTVTVSGYSEEYRLQQVQISPILRWTILGPNLLPELSLTAVVGRIRKLQQWDMLEDNPGLARLLELPPASALQHGFYRGGDRQKQIEYICMSLNNSEEKAQSRFPDLTNARNVSTFVVGNQSGGNVLRNFLYQIMLGCELLIRLTLEPLTTSYAGLITDTTSALLVLGERWMSSVVINGPSLGTPVDHTDSYTFSSLVARNQTETLLRFGEVLRWPYMDEARDWIENSYSAIAAGSQACNPDVWDWLFGMALPGQIYRHRIMAVLIHASPSVRHLNGSPFFSNGLVVGGRSYWPKRTVLGHVLGGVGDVKSVCGWIGPLPAPQGSMTGWVRLSARHVTIPVPVNEASGQDGLAELGIDDSEQCDQYALLESILDPNEWVETMAPTRSPGCDQSQSILKALHLTQVPGDPALSTTFPHLPSTQYRASLDFEVDGSPVTYILYANPVFVAAPQCAGTHLLHKNQGKKFLASMVRVGSLKTTDPALHELLIIDALGPGEEVVARAWCAERSRNAVIRRGAECCFSCATYMTLARKGLGFNVLILSK